MKQVFLLGTFLLLLAGPLAPGARAQCAATPQLLPAGCAPDQVFRAVDVATGQEVQSLCVGQQVRFELGCGRQVAPSLLFYPVQVTPNVNTTTINCTFNSSTNTNLYTPTAAGAVTVAELANPVVAGGTGTLFTRNFQVYASPAPTFTLAACLNNQAQLTITDASYDQYVVRVGGAVVGTPLAPGVTTIIAAPPGSSVSVAGVHAGNALCTNQNTQAVPTLPAATTPALTRLTTSGPLPGSLLLDVGSLPAGYRYDVQRADASAPGGYRRVAAVAAGSSTVTLPSAPAGAYRLGRRDVCQTDSAFSAAAPTLELSGASLNNVNTLSWRAGGPVASYTLLRDGVALTPAPAPGATTYADAAVVCGTRYTYRLQATAPGGPGAVSNEVAVQTVSTLPPPAPLLNASFDLTNRLVLTVPRASGNPLPVGSSVIYTRQGSPAFAPVPASNDTLRDPATLAELLASPPCYTAALQDVCGNRSPSSPPTCPALLTAEAADPEGRTVRLSWTPLRGPESPARVVAYNVLTLAADGTVLATTPPQTSLTYLDANPPADRQILRYRIVGGGGGLPQGNLSYSNVASLTRRPVLAVPNAFTPNGDGLNDVLELKGRYLAAFTFVVVDRNGQEVFRATDRGQTWDGTIRGHAPVNAAYVWRFTMQDEAGQPFTQTGSVSIIK